MNSSNELPDIFKNSPSERSLDELEKKALDVIASLSLQYVDWATNDVAKLKNLYEQAKCLTSQEQDNLIRGELYRTAHDIKGQGATFDYPLMTELGAHICTTIKTTTVFNETHLEVIARDIEDMSFVLENNIQGDGGAIGQRIHNRLKSDNT